MVMDRSDSLNAAAKLVYPTMPTLLCIQHINKKILANCKRMFTTKEGWDSFYTAQQNLIQSPTPEIFEDHWLQFTSDYDHGSTEYCIDYIKDKQIKAGQIEQLVTAWTNQYQHFDTTVTSRYV